MGFLLLTVEDVIANETVRIVYLDSTSILDRVGRDQEEKLQPFISKKK